MLDWNSLYKSGRDFGILPRAVIDIFLNHIDPNAPKTFLDIGCGTGQLSRALHERGYVGTGIDLSEEAILIASSKNGGLTYKQFDIENDDIDLLNGPYGLITCKHTYAFIKNTEHFLYKVSNLLHNNGSFVIITPLVEDVPTSQKSIAVSEKVLKRDLSKYFTIAYEQKIKSGQLFVLQPKKDI